MLFLQLKSQELSIQFAETSRQLEELKAKQKALEERNTLLEKLMLLNQQQQSGHAESSNNVFICLRFSTLQTQCHQFS